MADEEDDTQPVQAPTNKQLELQGFTPAQIKKVRVAFGVYMDARDARAIATDKLKETKDALWRVMKAEKMHTYGLTRGKHQFVAVRGLRTPVETWRAAPRIRPSQRIRRRESLQRAAGMQPVSRKTGQPEKGQNEMLSRPPIHDGKYHMEFQRHPQVPQVPPDV